MKKIYTSVIIAMVTFNSIAYAAQSFNKVNDNIETKKYFCPESITCTKSGDAKSCSYNVENPEYWNNTIIYQVIDVDTYKLISVTASFHSPNVDPVVCHFKGKAQYNSSMQLYSKKESTLEIFYSDPTNWTFPNSATPYSGTCSAINSNAQLCPLKEQPALVFYNANMGGGVSVSINNTEVSRALSNQYGKVNYDTALHYCKGGKECRIDFASTQGMFYGDVTVDVENNMKIVRVNTINPSYVSIGQMGGYNAVQVNFVSFLAQ